MSRLVVSDPGEVAVGRWRSSPDRNRLIPAAFPAECREEAGRVMAAGKPTNWLAAGVVITI